MRSIVISTLVCPMQSVIRLASLSYEQFCGHTHPEKRALLDACVLELIREASAADPGRGGQLRLTAAALLDAANQGAFRHAYVQGVSASSRLLA
jgi:hypothetical protein